MDELSKLQVYLIIFNVGCLILTFWVLPILVAAATPFKYKDVIQVSRDALVTAFTTGSKNRIHIDQTDRQGGADDLSGRTKGDVGPGRFPEQFDV